MSRLTRIGKAQLISNINACEAVTSILKTTLGPRGRDKLIHGIHIYTFIIIIISSYHIIISFNPSIILIMVDNSQIDGNRVTITNDGATIIKLLDVVHPAAKTLVDIARSQDEEVGDGTTSVCLITGEILASMKPLIEEGMHPNVIIRG
jgi:T-complex protein 1 subunit eta